MQKKILVAVFSASGVTKRVGEAIARVSGGDFFEIEPIKSYSAADLDWMNQNSRSSVEMKDPTARPEIAKQVEDMDAYDTIIIGFPIWWGVAPRIIETFLESYDFSNKTIIPFCTSAGSSCSSQAGSFRCRKGCNQPASRRDHSCEGKCRRLCEGRSGSRCP